VLLLFAIFRVLCTVILSQRHVHIVLVFSVEI
jgi:hypothetical protein